MTRLLFVFMSAMILLSCDKPKVDYREVMDTTAVVDDRIGDTTKILVSGLPVKFDSTDVLLFPISLVDLKERGGYGIKASGSYSDSEAAFSYFDGDYLPGNFINVVFQGKSGGQRKLTDNKVLITRVSFMREIFKRTGYGHLLYTVRDRDSNGDKELDYADLEALYISSIDGSNFKKVTKELHEFYDWSIINGEDRVYFRTLEDRNKDGELDNKDQFHYYIIDFTGNTYSINEYNPLKVFE